MRFIIVILSTVGVIITGYLVMFALVMSSSWTGKAAIPLFILLSFAGFASVSVGSIFGYYKNWYKAVAVFGSILIACTSYPWFSENAEWAGFGMLLVAALTTLDACKNH